jgi:hypothetical protein
MNAELIARAGDDNSMYSTLLLKDRIQGYVAKQQYFLSVLILECTLTLNLLANCIRILTFNTIRLGACKIYYPI